MASSTLKSANIKPAGIRVLSIDAGGVRCLCPLYILEEISTVLHPGIRTSESDSGGQIKLWKPCQYFDLICGSEWGGVIAIMLGRLRMSVAECISWFQRKAAELQEPSSVSRMFRTTPGISSHYERSRSQKLKEIFLSLLQELDLLDSTCLYEPTEDDELCKTLILVSDQITGSSVRLRSYTSKSDGGANIDSMSILDAALATVAGPMASAPVMVGKRMLISADFTGYANPSKEAFDEATRIWSVQSVKIIVSLGTGTKGKELGPRSGVFGVLHLTSNILFDSDRVDQELYRDSRIAGFDCFRFRGPEALVTRAERQSWTKINIVKSNTRSYLVHADVSSSIVACINGLIKDGDVDDPFLKVSTEDISEDESDYSDFVAADSCPMVMSTESKTVEGAGIASENSVAIDATNLESVDFQSSNQGISDHLRENGPTATGSNHPQTFIGELDNDSASTNSETSQDSSKVLLFDSRSAVMDSAIDESSDKFVRHHKQTMRKIFPAGAMEYSSKVKIAVLDTGIDPTHPFIQRHWKPPQTFDETFPWYDFVGDDQSVIQDTSGHGTHIAGIILQLAPFVELHVARVFDTGRMDKGAPGRVAKAIRHAVDIWGVDIISMSFGFEDWWPEIDEAMEHAYVGGTIMLAAASNNGLRPEFPVAFPARTSKLGQVFCINSATPFGKSSYFNPPLAADNRDNFSTVGENVRSTWPFNVKAEGIEQDKRGTWKRQSGTSVATPIAAATAACIMQFGRMNKGKIGKHVVKLLEEYRGIRQIFMHMAVDRNRFKSEDGFAFISPETLFNSKNWSSQDTISGELEKELQKIL